MKDRVRIVLEVAKAPNLRRAELAFLGFNMAEFATWVAILVYAYSRGGAAASGLVALIQLVPAGIVAPFASVAGDRFRPERVLVVSSLVQAATQGAVAIALRADAPLAVTYALAAVAASSLTSTRPALAALLPRLARTPEELTAANSVSGLAESVGMLIGPLVAGILLNRSDASVVFAVFAVVSLIGAGLNARVRVPDEPSVERPRILAREAVRDTIEGLSVVRGYGDLRVLVTVQGLIILVVGALDVLVVAVAIDLLERGEGWAGFLSSALGLGGIVGAVASVALVGHRRLTPAVVEGSGVFGVPIAAVALAPSVIATPVLFGVTGAGRVLASVAANTLLQRSTPPQVLSRVFGVLEGLGMFALATGSVVAAVVTEWLGVRASLVVVGALVPICVALLAPRILSIDASARPPDPDELDLLRRMSIFSPLSPPVLERIANALIPLDVPVGTVVIHEGDPGDRFYAIAQGEVAITREGSALASLAKGNYFGEIALLRDIPRTATATAVTDLRLLALERAPFLEAVTGHPQSREHAESTAQQRLDEHRNDGNA